MKALAAGANPIKSSLIASTAAEAKSYEVTGNLTKMRNKYGYFDPKTGEYVIIRPDTPNAWYNYIHNGQYGGLISHTAGGLSFYRDPRHRRLLRYRFNTLPADRPGRYIYLRDDATGRYWSATWAPTCPDLNAVRYRCYVGLGYQRIATIYDSIEAEVVYFVPPDDPCEIWLLSLKNLSDSSRCLSVFSYAELCLWSAHRDMINMDSPKHTTRIEMRPDGVILHKSYTDLGMGLSEMQFVQFFGFAAISKPFYDYDINREDFIGPNRSEANPIVVETAKHRSPKTPTGNPLASFHQKIRLEPGKTDRTVYVLGICDGPKSYKPIVRKYTSDGAAERALAQLKAIWQNRLARMRAKTSDKGFDQIVNIWNPYQCHMNFYLSRSIAPYSTGISRGIGYRDTSQDCLAAVLPMPKQVAQRLDLLLANQFADGTACHNFFPDTGEGEGAHFYDDHLWFILTLSLYCRETGDLEYLTRKKIKFRDRGSGCVLEHIERALDASWRLVGKHGLPLAGIADWNDSLNPPSGTESIFTSMLYCKALADAADLAAQIGEKRLASLWTHRRKTIRDRINRYGWDGKWYKRHLLPDGSAIGSAKCKEGKIFLEPQVWSVISGVATPPRSKAVLTSMRRYLLTPHGLKLQHPPYSRYDPTVGSVGIFRPGLKENGAVFCHTNPWAIIAYCLLSRGDDAYEIYRRISPFERNKIIEVHQNDPYVFSQFITTAPHPHEGRAWNAWLTGTASWTYIALTQYILGIRPDFDGLVINPCIPRSWEQLTVRRLFRDAAYEIKILHPRGKTAGVAELTVDKRPIRGNKAPIFADGKVHYVHVVLG